MAEKIAPVILYSLMLGMLITGTLNTVFLKIQNITRTFYLDDDENQLTFNHPFFQTFCMFIGEVLCLGVYGISYWRDSQKYGDASLHPEVIKAKKAGLKTNINVFILAIPA